jgi:hypothetical protein
MSFLHKQSYECSKTELDLFEVPPTQVSFEAARIVEYYPISVIDNGPIEFFISGSSDEYIDLSQTFLYIKAKVEGTGNGKSHSPANNLLHAMFQQVDVSLNETLVTASVNTYPYRAMMETLLNYGSDAKDSHCTASLFYKDTAEKMNSYDGTNPGGQIRSKIAALNTNFDMYGRLHVDLFFQDRLLINNVNVRVKLHRSKNAFCFVSDGTPALRILSAMLHVRKVRVNPKIMLAHAAVLEKTTIKYPIKRVETKTFTISSGVASITLDNVSLGPLPKKIVFALVTSKAYNGDLTENCFKFQNLGLSKVSVSIDGEEAPYSPLELDFSNFSYVKAYYTLFNGLDRACLDIGNNISFLDYKDGYTMFAFDLTPDMCNGDHFNLVKNGNLRISLNFKTNLGENVNCLVYMEHENIIEINKARQILYDYKI